MSTGKLVSRLWRDFVSRYAFDIGALIPALALVALSGISYALLLKYTTESIQAGDLAAIALAPVAAIIASVIRAGSIYTQAVMCQGLALKVLRDIQNAMFAKLMVVDFARFSREDVGQLVSRFTNDVTVVGEGLVRGLQTGIRDFLTLIGAIGLMLWFDPILAGVVLLVFAIAGGPLGAIARRARRATTAAQIQIGTLSALLTESFGAARFVKTYGLEQREGQRAGVAFEERRRIAMKLAKNRASSEPIVEIVGGLALGGVLYLAGMRIAAGAMTLGDLLGIMGAVAVATPSARAVGQFNTALNEAFAALARIFGLLDEPHTIAERAGAKPMAVSTGRIEFDNVSFSYGEGAALDGVSFSVAPGETVALVGPSGAGKSTIFNLLPRLYDVTGGSVRIDGQDVRDATLLSLRASMALVAQESALFNDTIRNNIALGKPGASQAEIEAAAKAAAAHDFILGLPGGYDSMAGERGASLSGGERQRVALARAFLRDAPILLLDEATSALDAESEAKVQDALKRLAKGRTVLVIAHRLSTIRDADRILALENGRIVETGAHEDLMRAEGLYARLSRLQFADS